MPRKLVTVDGKLLVIGGKFVTTNEDGTCGDCCAEAETCGACGENWPDEIQVDIDAAAATANPADPFADCDDADCQDLSGVYVLTKRPYVATGTWDVSYTTDMGTVTVATFNWSDTCEWELHLDDNPETLPCVSVNHGDVLYYGLKVRVALASDGDYYVWVQVYWSDAVPYGTGIGSAWQWLKNVGSTAPDCTTLNEAFANAQYVYQGTIFGTPIEEINESCYYDDITFDVLAL